MDAKTRGRNQTAAVKLLKRVLATGWFQPDAVARALVISDAALEAYLTESQPMPLDRQLCLALFVIECVPPLSRAGHQLRGQIAATIAFHRRAAEMQIEAPPPRHF